MKVKKLVELFPNFSLFKLQLFEEMSVFFTFSTLELMTAPEFDFQKKV